MALAVPSRRALLKPRFYPSLDLNFVTGSTTLDSRITFTRADAATCATYRDPAGVRQTAAANVARFDHTAAGVPLGLLIEESRTNYLLNSQVPATQTTGALGTGTYTLWIEGSGSVAVTAGTATLAGNGIATEGSPDTFTVDVAGTVTCTVTGTVTAFQLEAGAFATSLIVTVGATVTRAADVATISTLTPWFNALEGTLFWDAATFRDTTDTAQVFNVSDGTTNNLLNLLFNSGGALRFAVRAGGALSGATNDSTWGDGATDRVAGSFFSGGTLLSANGGISSGSLSAGLPSGLTTAQIGSFNTAQYLNGRIRRVSYYPRRLPNAALQELTR